MNFFLKKGKLHIAFALLMLSQPVVAMDLGDCVNWLRSARAGQDGTGEYTDYHTNERRVRYRGADGTITDAPKYYKPKNGFILDHDADGADVYLPLPVAPDEK